MRLFKRLTFQLVISFFFAPTGWGQLLRLINNQEFPVRLPVEIRDFAQPPGVRVADQPTQLDGTNLVFTADVPAGSQKDLPLHQRSPSPPLRDQRLSVQPAHNGIGIRSGSAILGTLSWDILLQNRKRTTDSEKSGAKPDFDSGFTPLPLQFAKANSGPVFEDWKAEALKSGLRLSIALRCFHDGFLDISTRLMNESAEPTTNIYAAAVCRWEQNGAATRSFCYDNHITPLGDKAQSLFREGEGRHLTIQRGVDWVRTSFSSGQTVAWLNDFAPSFTVKTEATARTPAHFTGANASLLGREIQTAGNRLYFITEIARSSVRSFRDRLKENILMPQGELVSFSSRLIFGDASLNDKGTDELFVAWNSFNAQENIPGGKAFSFGTPLVRFGTSYFPYSTLGENFDAQKLPGMDRESFWPLAADTVNQWRMFADDIRRDLRIAKAMGFQLIRLHHLELLAPIKKSTRQEYLDFVFSELRHLQLKALLDVYASPTQIAELLTRYGDTVDAVEVENETLIWGIPLDRPKEWTELYAAIKKTAPHVRIHFTGYNNTGMFDRLSVLDVPFDRVCLHSYIDTLDAIPSARGYSLALSSYANKVGKPPLITEWNWRGLTRMTEQARAKIYPQIIEGAIGTRGIPDFYQFQFNETLCPNPRLGRGNILRHYELLHLSRRPKAEAMTLMEIIRKYSAPNDFVRQIEVSHPVIELSPDGPAIASITITNAARQPLKLTASVESGEDLFTQLEDRSRLTLAPGERQSVKIRLQAVQARPGFYYAFMRLTSADGQLRYGWIEARLPGAPAFQEPAPKIDWTGPIVVAYGREASVLEVETATAIAETLESASGCPAEAVELDAEADISSSASVIIVGTESSKPNRKKPTPVITGADAQAVERAGMNFILSYWKTAKDSAAAKVGLVAKELPRGGDAAKLP